jgi:hypothetical protein
MLGELILEEKGKTTGLRVLPSEGTSAKVEVSFQGSGKVLGIEHTDMGTYHSVARSDGSLFGEGQGVVMTKDGGMATWKGHGIGRFAGRGSAVNWRGAIYYQTSSQKLARLNGVAAIFEFDVDEDGNCTSKIWEWK